MKAHLQELVLGVLLALLVAYLFVHTQERIPFVYQGF